MITFNYDTLVETTYLTQLGADGGLLAAVLLPPGGVRPYTNIWGQPGSAESFALCKLHGSINWFWHPDGFDRSVIDVGIDNRWPGTVPPSTTGDPPLTERAGSREPFIVPPTSLKGPFFQHDTLRHHWTYAQKKLAEAERVWIVGYSLPLTDMVAGSLISTLSGSLPEISVVNWDAEPVAARVMSLISGAGVLEITGEDAVETFARSYAIETQSLSAEQEPPVPGASNRLVPVPHSPETVVSLRIALPGGGRPERPFPLQEGPNQFVCYATFIDGSEHPFDAYWTCPLFERGGGVQLWSVFGKQRRAGVTVSASDHHERYQELACWARLPEPTSNDIPHDVIAFDYSSFVSST